VSLYTTTDLAAWDDLAAECPGATFFHRAPWLGAVADTTGGRFEGAIVELDGGAVGLVPIIRRPALAGWWAEGTSGDTGAFPAYGGLISTSRLSIEQVEAVYEALARAWTDLRVVGNPHAPGPHLPEGAGGRTTPAAPAQLLELAHVAPLHLKRDQELFFVPGPQEFQADMFGGLEPAAPPGLESRPRAFYYHLFRRADARQVAMLLLREQGQPVAGVLVGLDGAIATILGLAGTPAGQRVLVSQLAEGLGRGVRWLDLGPRATSLAIEVRATRHARPLAVWARQSAPLKLLTRLRRPPRRAS
jgi:hypothetical protein